MISSRERIAGGGEDGGDGARVVERRRFLGWLSAAAASVSTALLSVPIVRALFSPALQPPPPDTWVKVADDTALLDTDVPIRVDFITTRDDAWVEARVMNSVWLYTEDGETFKAYNGHCTHLGCGFVYNPERKVFICPCHLGEFDAKTGAVLAGPPPRPLDELETEVRDAAVYVKYRDFRLGVPEKIEA